MSLVILPVLSAFVSFPRVSGDEPVTPSGSRFGSAFSPRERG